MPNGLNNWTFRDVETFLKEYDFSMNHIKGSHYFYIGYPNKVMHQVCVPRHSSLSIKPRTMKGIILQSGIPKDEWLRK
ncbi:MAG: type II toxin-antitoxin system HicA family toxin [Candidatus Taylorbacteria bacterium]|nr:type II toxin-antitoxin system HicA family toxin [Candidatus Taylorbacteria bacterium]